MGIAARMEAATPPDRDRYLDLLRVVAVSLVVLGHWLVRAVLESEGAMVARYLLDIAPHWQWATLVWQVMPVFFFIGGAVNAGSWRRARAEGTAAANWASRRARLLVYPVLTLLAVLVPAAAALHLAPGHAALIFDFGVAILPLWFLAVYLATTALTPFTLALHERGHSLALIGLGAGLAVIVDLARFATDGPRIGTQPVIAIPNFLLIWIVIHQFGYLWADGKLPAKARWQALLTLAGAGVAALMIGSGVYPLSMVPIEGTARPNNGSPPSAALIALATVQIGFALLLRAPVSRWLRRPVVWAPVALIGSQIFVIYLWHQPVMVAVANIAYPAGWLPLGEAIDGRWWLNRPVWVLVCSAVLVPVVAVMARIGMPQRIRRAPPRRGWLAVLSGVALFGLGVSGLIATRMVQPEMPLGLPLLPLAAILAGAAALGLFTPTRRSG